MNEKQVEWRSRAAKAARAVLADKLSYSDFMKEIMMPESDGDPLIGDLIDLIEHIPKRGGWFGVSEETWTQYKGQIEEAITALEHN